MFNATRLTCFALISAIESDSRNLVTELQESLDLKLPISVQEKAESRFTHDRGASPTDRESIVDFLDFADTHEFLLSNKQHLDIDLKESLRAVASRLGQFTQTRNRVAHSRPLDLSDLPLTVDIAKQLVRDSPRKWLATQETITRIEVNPSSVLGLTVSLVVDPLNEPFHNLPIPDFDETGFQGRSSAVKTIKRYVLGSWPAISILGDGGIGKSAIALKVAYDLLDDPKSDFDAIVWVSAKSQRLTVHEIERINGAIQDSVGMFEEAANQLGRSSDEDPLDALLEYMSTFKVLLILDNLETVSDGTLREFLREIPRGSKVLMTSRIGVFKENDVKLEPLSDDETRSLLMALASGRNVKVLKELDETGRRKLVAKLKGHPLYVKWVVAGVQSGKRPSDMVGSNKLLLDFCMSNVFEELSAGARNILQSMQALQGIRYQGELAYITETPALTIQESLLDLMRSNFVSMTYVSGADSDAGYEIGEFAREYLVHSHPIPETLRRKVLSRRDELASLSSRLQRGVANAGKYDPKTVAVRDLHNAPAARLLIQSIKTSRAGDIERAMQLCKEAQYLSPGYYETRRVEGYLHSLKRDQSAALQCFEMAVELADEISKPVALVHLSAFLEQESMQLEDARAHLEEAARLDPSSCEIFYRIGLMYFNNANYFLALGSVAAATKKQPNTRQWQLLHELLVRSATFGGEGQVERGRLGDAIELIENALDVVSEVPATAKSAEFDDWYLHIARLCERIAQESGDVEYLGRKATALVVTCLGNVFSRVDMNRTSGIISKLPEGNKYGFVQSGEAEYFFHASELIDRKVWRQLVRGNLLSFDVAYNEEKKKYQARNVRALL